MKIAIFHNFLDNIGGAEIVTFILARELGADIYTTNIDKEKIRKMGFKNLIPKIKSIGKVPLQAPFRHQLALYKFSKLKLRGYNFYIISGDWAISGARNNKPNLYYCHTPPRELWDLRKFVKKEVIKMWQRPFFDLWVYYNRYLLKKYIKDVQNIVCNSKNTQKRVERFYKRDSAVINPPVETSKYRYRKPKNYWLSVNRITRHKRIEMQIKAFAKMPEENLIIVGSYEKGARQFENYKSYIEKIRPKNVKILNWVKDEELRDLYSFSKGLITTSKDEDFGLTPLEAMASGKPVIAPNEGGYKETIVSPGVLINNITEDKIIEAVNKIKGNRRKSQKRAEEFDTKIFIKKIRQWL